MNDPKQNAAGGSGAKSNLLSAKSTAEHYSPKGYKFNHTAFLCQSAGDIALLYLSAAQVANGQTCGDPAEILRAVRRIVSSLAQHEPKYAHGQLFAPIGYPCGWRTGTYRPGTCKAHWCPTFELMDGEEVLGDCRLAYSSKAVRHG